MQPRVPTSFDALRDDLWRIAELTSFYSEDSTGYTGNSRAHHDVEQRAYGGPWASQPAMEAILLAARCLGLCADVTRGVAALLPVQMVLYSNLALIRPAMTSASRCLYLVDSEIDTAERTRRWANLAMDSLVERGNIFPAGSAERAETEARLEEFEGLASVLGVAIKKRNTYPGLVRPRSIGNHEPEIVMVKRIVEDSATRERIGDINVTMYRMASGLIHGQDYAQMLHVDTANAKATSHPHVAVAQSVLTLPNAALWFTAALLAIVNATEGFLKYQGKSRSKLDQTWLPVFAGWRQIYPPRHDS